MEYWKKILKSQRARGKSGLTIPFIIGSQHFLKQKKYKYDIPKLIFEIVEKGIFEITLTLCPDIHTLILEIKKPYKKVYYPKFNGNEQINLSVAITLMDEFGDTIENIISKLAERFQDKINNGEFSAKNSQDQREAIWDSFCEIEDIPFIIGSLNEE